MERFRKYIQNLLEKPEIDHSLLALKEIENFLKDFECLNDDIEKTIIVKKSRVNRLKQEERNQTLSRDERERERNKITSGIIDLLNYSLRLIPNFLESAIVKIGGPEEPLAMGFFISKKRIMTCYDPLKGLIDEGKSSVKIYTNNPGQIEGKIVTSFNQREKELLKNKNIALIVIPSNQHGATPLSRDDEPLLKPQRLIMMAGHSKYSSLKRHNISSVIYRIINPSEYTKPNSGSVELELPEWGKMNDIELMTGTPLVQQNKDGDFCFYGLVEKRVENSNRFSAISLSNIDFWNITNIILDQSEFPEEKETNEEEECARYLKDNIFQSKQQEGTWKQVICCIKDDQQIKRSSEVEKTTDVSLPPWEMNIFRSGLEKALTESSAYQSFLKKNRNFLEDWLCWMFLHQYEPDFIARNEPISKIFFLYLSLSWIDDKYFEQNNIRDKQLNDIILTLKDRFVQCFDLNLKTSSDGTKTLILIKKLVDWETEKEIMLGPQIYWLLCSRSKIPLTELEKNFSDRYWFKLMKNKLKRFQKNFSSTFDASFLSQHELSAILEEWLYLPKLYTIYDYRYANATEKIEWDNFKSFVEVISRLMESEKKENQDKFEYNTTYQVAFSACPKTGNYDFN